MPATSSLRTLAPIVTNLAHPDKTWIRIEALLVMDEQTPDAGTLSAQIVEDIVAFLQDRLAQPDSGRQRLPAPA